MLRINSMGETYTREFSSFTVFLFHFIDLDSALVYLHVRFASHAFICRLSLLPYSHTKPIFATSRCELANFQWFKMISVIKLVSEAIGKIGASVEFKRNRNRTYIEVLLHLHAKSLTYLVDAYWICRFFFVLNANDI